MFLSQAWTLSRHSSALTLTVKLSGKRCPCCHSWTPRLAGGSGPCLLRLAGRGWGGGGRGCLGVAVGGGGVAGGKLSLLGLWLQGFFFRFQGERGVLCRSEREPTVPASPFLSFIDLPVLRLPVFARPLLPASPVQLCTCLPHPLRSPVQIALALHSSPAPSAAGSEHREAETPGSRRVCTQACKASQVAENSGGAAGGVFVMLDTCGSNLDVCVCGSLEGGAQGWVRAWRGCDHVWDMGAVTFYSAQSLGLSLLVRPLVGPGSGAWEWGQAGETHIWQTTSFSHAEWEPNPPARLAKCSSKPFSPSPAMTTLLGRGRGLGWGREPRHRRRRGCG